MIATLSSSQLDTLIVDYICDELPEEERVAFEDELVDHPELAAEVQAHQSLRRQWSGVEGDAEVPGPIIARIMEEAELVLWTALAARRESGSTSEKPSFLERLTAFLMQPSMAAAMVFVLIGTTGIILSQNDDPPLAPGASEARTEAPAELRVAHKALAKQSSATRSGQPAAKEEEKAPTRSAATPQPEKAPAAATKAKAVATKAKAAPTLAKAPNRPTRSRRALGKKDKSAPARVVGRASKQKPPPRIAAADKTTRRRVAKAKSKQRGDVARPAVGRTGGSAVGGGSAPTKPTVADATLLKRYRAALTRGRLARARALLRQLKRRGSLKTKVAGLTRELAKAEARAKIAASRTAKKAKGKKRATKRAAAPKRAAPTRPSNRPAAKPAAVKTK